MVFQIGAALLDACVLAVLRRGDTYGYKLSREIMSVVDISESTLYPVLRRLQKDGCLTTYDEPVSGRNRRYYKLTEKGREKCTEYILEWKKHKNSIDLLLGGKDE